MAEKTSRKTPPPPKRPWRRPQVKTGQLFESNSLACGKVFTPAQPPMDQCDQIATTS